MKWVRPVQTVKAANNGIDAITTLIESAKSLSQNSALSADSTTEASSLGSQFNTILDQIDTLAADSGYKGINLLNGTDVELNVKFDEKGDSSITLTGFKRYIRAGGWRPRHFGCDNGGIDRGRGRCLLGR